ncbi:hypothetical protein L804_04014 [Cryptococcus deuterogattii 2001/935-1]|nr:hypothetical protein L804_04014 [Cryptococcus deuterogattii 2001/935-1]
MSALPYYLINAFPGATSHSGSQCAVVIIPENDTRFEDSVYLQNVASDFNYPATAYLPFVKKNETEAEYELRWFAVGELPFCGHGTVSSAKTIFSLYPSLLSIVFRTKVGDLKAMRVEEKVEVSVPEVPIDEKIPDISWIGHKLEEVTTISSADIVNVATFDWDGPNVLVEIKPEFDLKKATVDGKGLGNLKAPMTIITQMAGEDEASLKIRSRVFLPDAASSEDPVVSIFMLQPVGWAG